LNRTSIESLRDNQEVSRSIVPTLPLDHPDPLAATLATMHYPNADDRKQRQVLIDCLMPLVQSYRQSSQSFGCDQLVGQAVGMAGTELPDLEERIFAATAVGQVNKAYFVLAWNGTKTASWANARKTANTVAGPIAKRRISDSYFKAQRKRFESVTHLWTALCLQDLSFRPEPFVGYNLNADFQSFVAEGEYIRRWGRTWKRAASDATPPFEGIDMWAPPFYWNPPFRRKGWPLAGGVADLALAPELTERLRPRGRPHNAAAVNPA
jgi:hypothetical protein